MEQPSPLNPVNPATGKSTIDAALVNDIVQAGMLAPSGDNCQPWHFIWNGSQLDIVFQPQRAESLYDVNNMASWISLGAVLANMRIAATQHGLELNANLFPDEVNRNLVAAVRFTPSLECEKDPLFQVLTQRCANRRAYESSPLPPELSQELLSLATTVPGMQLDLIDKRKPKAQVASLAARNDIILYENQKLHNGLYRWIRWTPEETNGSNDGLPIESLELNSIDRMGFRALASWGMAKTASLVGVPYFLWMRACRIYRKSAAVGLLSVDGTKPEDFIRAGQLLERIWLTVTLRGFSFQPITGITCLILRCRLAKADGLALSHQNMLATIEKKLTKLFPALQQKTPIMLFRLGRASASPSRRSPRRPVSAVLKMTTQ